MFDGIRRVLVDRRLYCRKLKKIEERFSLFQVVSSKSRLHYTPEVPASCTGFVFPPMLPYFSSASHLSLADMDLEKGFSKTKFVYN